jgi:hypothetical protein
MPPDAGPAFLVLSHEDVKGGLWEPLRLASLILLPLILSYDDLLALGRLGLRWLNQDLIPVELDHVHVCQEWVFVEIHLLTLYKFQLFIIYGRLNPSMKNIAIVSSMRIRIMSFTISMPFELFQRWYDMITWQLNLFFLQQVIKDLITFSDVKSVTHLVLPTFRSRLQARAYEWFRFGHPTPFNYTHVDLFVIWRLATILYHVNVMLVPRLVATPKKVSRLFGSAFAI